MFHSRHALSVLAIAFPLLLTTPTQAADPQPRPIDWQNLDQSALDLTPFLPTPAGRDGFIRVQNGHFIRPDGSRFRIWGVNLVGESSFPEKPTADRLAADLARFGINCVRFHGLDAPWGDRNIFIRGANDTRHLDPESLDRFDYLVAQLKARGIYTDLNLNVFRNFRAGDDVRDFHLLGLGKSATYFNPHLIELQREFARQLLTHRNAYTGNEYRHEPAVVFIELVNENSVLEGWAGSRLVGKDDPQGDWTWKPIPTSYANELTDQYNAWLPQNLPAETLAAIRKEAAADAHGPVPRLQPDQFPQASRERFQAEARFYVSLENRFFADMKALIKDELAAGPIVMGTADHNDSVSGYPHVSANATFEAIDGHGYWEHPRLDSETWIKNTPMVNDPLDSTVVQFARTPMLGLPYTITETNHPFPHEYACEGIPILTAYAMLQDWDALFWFTWTDGRMTPADAGIRKNGWFDLSLDPVKVPSVAACGLLWHRQDIRPAQQLITRAYDETQILESLRMDRGKERPFFDPAFPRSTPLQHATRWTLDPSAATPYPPAADLGRILSDTGELAWLHADRKQGLVTIQTPRTEALIGHVKAAQPTLPHLSPQLETEFASLVLTSLDNRPIAESRRLLLLTGSRVANSGQQWKDDHQTLAAWGAGPVQVEPLRGTIQLRALATPDSPLQLHPLSPIGAPLTPPIEIPPTPNGWSFPLDAIPASWYLIELSP